MWPQNAGFLPLGPPRGCRVEHSARKRASQERAEMTGANTRISNGKVHKRFHMFMSEKVKSELQQAADREGCSLKDYLLAGAYERLRRRPVMKPEEYREIVELHEQLRRVGINLNTLIRSGLIADMSRRRRPLEEEYQEVLDELLLVSAEIRKFSGQFRKWAE